MSTTVIPMERLLTVEEVIAHLQISRSKLYQLVREGQLRAVKIGRTVRFRSGTIQAFIEQSEQVVEVAKLARDR